jgi:hypothetical protein
MPLLLCPKTIKKKEKAGGRRIDDGGWTSEMGTRHSSSAQTPGGGLSVKNNSFTSVNLYNVFVKRN